jgi:hypothetical protein
MLLTSLQSDVARPHLGRIEAACGVGPPDIRAHMAQVVRELAKDADVPGFHKGKAPLRRVQAHWPRSSQGNRVCAKGRNYSKETTITSKRWDDTR